jgi:hypothetical protein
MKWRHVPLLSAAFFFDWGSSLLCVVPAKEKNTSSENSDMQAKQKSVCVYVGGGGAERGTLKKSSRVHGERRYETSTGIFFIHLGVEREGKNVKSHISFVMSVRPSVRPQVTVPINYPADINKTWYGGTKLIFFGRFEDGFSLVHFERA